MIRSPQTWHLRADAKLQSRELDCSHSTVVATPGAGKTYFGAMVAKRRFDNNTITKLMVVVPNVPIVRQWMDEAAQHGIQLSDNISKDKELDGYVVTYQSLVSGANALLHQWRCSTFPTMCIFDEIHHLGHDLAWGTNAKLAFTLAKQVLGLSGTPFRTKGDGIPFNEYDDQGRLKPVYTYGYSDALRDGICRPVFFPRQGGTAEWKWGEQIETASFDDDLDEEGASKRLRTALLKGDFVDALLIQAHDKLMMLRQKQNAAGLVFAMDTTHARIIAERMQKLFGIQPVIALNDEPQAKINLERFKNSQEPWLVACKMTAEGYDNSRVQVGVWATNVCAELSVKQGVGRTVRVDKSLENNNAFFFIPNDPRLRKHAENIKNDREYAPIQSESVVEYDQDSVDRSSSKTLFIPLGSTAEYAGVTFDGNSYGPVVDQKAKKYGIPVETMAEILRDEGNCTPPPTTTTPSIPKARRKAQKRTEIQQLVAQIAHRTGQLHQDIHKRANNALGLPTSKEANEEQLNAKLLFLKRAV